MLSLEMLLHLNPSLNSLKSKQESQSFCQFCLMLGFYSFRISNALLNPSII